MFNLMNGINLQDTKAELAKYEQVNKSIIIQNATRAAAESQAAIIQKEYEREQLRRARELAAANLEAKRLEKAEAKAALVKALQEGGDNVEAIIARNNKIQLKKSSMRRENQEKRVLELAAMRNAPAFDYMTVLSGKKDNADVDEGHFDPLEGLEEKFRYFTYRDSYENP